MPKRNIFKHENKKHTLILADSPEEHKPCPKQTSARCDISAGTWQQEDVITGLDWMQEIRIGKYTVSDFNFETPFTDLKVEAPTQHILGPGEREIYDYPAEYSKRTEGERLCNIRMQEEEARRDDQDDAEEGSRQDRLHRETARGTVVPVGMEVRGRGSEGSRL